jgi:hypothetical protein
MFNHSIKEGDADRGASSSGGTHKSMQNRSGATTPRAPIAPLRPRSICDSSDVRRILDELQLNRAPITPFSEHRNITSPNIDKSLEERDATASAD